MANLKELEQQVSSLSDEDFAAFRDWFEEFQADAWDRQLESGMKEGRLDPLVEHARQQHAAGKTTPL